MGRLFVVSLFTIAFLNSISLAQENTRSDAYHRYAEGLMKNYDYDQDGFLDQSEIKQMRRVPKNADQDDDGKISKQELIDSVAKKASQPKINPAKKTVSVRLELFEIQPDVKTESIAEFVTSLSGQIENLDKEIQNVIKHRGVNKVAAFSCTTRLNGKNEWKDKTKQAHFENEIQFKVTQIDPFVELELDWDYQQTEPGFDRTNSVSVAKRRAPGPNDEEELKQLIMDKIKERRRELETERRSQKQAIAKSVELSTQVACGPQGVGAIFINDNDSNWLVIVKTKTN